MADPFNLTLDESVFDVSHCDAALGVAAAEPLDAQQNRLQVLQLIAELDGPGAVADQLETRIQISFFFCVALF